MNEYSIKEDLSSFSQNELPKHCISDCEAMRSNDSLIEHCVFNNIHTYLENQNLQILIDTNNNLYQHDFINLLEKTKSFYILYNYSSKFYYTLDNILGILQILLTSFIAILLSSINITKNDIYYLVILYISSILTGIQQFSKLQVKANLYEESSKKFYILYNNIINKIRFINKKDNDSLKESKNLDIKNFYKNYNQIILQSPKINCIIIYFNKKIYHKINYEYPNNLIYENKKLLQNNVIELFEYPKND